MSKKERISASVDREVADYLGQDHVNASGLINQLVSRYMNGGGEGEMLRELRMQQLEDEYKDAASTAARKLKSLNQLREIETERESQKDADLLEFVEWMDANNEYVFKDHVDVAEIADKHFDGDRDETINTLVQLAESEGYDFEDKRFGL